MSKNREVTLRFLAEPGDQNFGGKVHGGAVMRWIDLAAYACAVGWSGRYCITAYVGGIRFVQPILVGSLVEVTATVIYTGRTSMHLSVDVNARDPKEQDSQKTTHCIVIMVAVDENGQSTPVPEWVPTTEKDIYLKDYAIRLAKMRTDIHEEMSNTLKKFE